MQDNIKRVLMHNSRGEYLELSEVANPVVDTAYFVALSPSWDDLASISVADDVFETDNTSFRSRLAKIQYAPRIVRIQGTITVPNQKNATPDELYQLRSNLLRQLIKLITPPNDLELRFRHADDPTSDLSLYCHLHGADALQVRKSATDYEVSITLIAEDPLIYGEKVESEEGIAQNNGDVPEYAEIVLPDCIQVREYSCIQGTTTQIVLFRTPVTGNIAINVAYPGQICSISGTSADNIDISDGKPAFIPVPPGASLWSRSDGGDVIVKPRSPKMGISP